MHISSFTKAYNIIFKAILDYLEPAASHLLYNNSSSGSGGRPRKLSSEEELFLVLVRLRGGYHIEDMSVRFNMSPSNISRILITWYDFLHTQFRSLPIWATRQTVDETMSKCFQTIYPKTRVILDCTEIFIEVPSSYRSQSATFSSYKHHNTVKGLVGIAPSGAVTFVSDLFTGRCSDKQIVRASGILDLLEKEDDVMADRGFEIEELLREGVTLNIPPFLNDEPRLSLQDELKTRKIASVRIHVERAIRRFKTFQIIHNILPLTMAADFNKIRVVCCYLTNLLPPLIAEEGAD